MPGYYMSPQEEEERRKRMAREQIARSQVQEQNIAAKRGMNPIAASRANPLQQIGQQVGKALLTKALGPLGMLFNLGGKVKGYNVGGLPMPPSNPNGYKEGGPMMQMPLKKVMDEDKIELARMAAMNAEKRKDQKAMADEKRAQEKHLFDMNMKRQTAMTNITPLAMKK